MEQAFTRRRFLGAAALVAAALPTGLDRALGAAGPLPVIGADDLPIIDAHHHLWQLKPADPSWPRSAMGRTITPAEYREAARGLGIVKAIYAEVAVTPTREAQTQEAGWIIGLCQAGQGFPAAATIGGNPAAPDFPDYAARYKDSPFVKGVRRIVDRFPSGSSHPFRAAEFIAGVNALAPLGLAYDICCGPTALDEAARLIDACPQTRFVLTHSGNPDPKAFGTATRGRSGHDPDVWRRGIESVARRGGGRVICKISHFIAGAEKGKWSAASLAPIVNHVIDSFGPERCVWGSDWPVCLAAATLAEWLRAFREIISARPREVQRKLLHDNAARFYTLA